MALSAFSSTGDVYLFVAGARPLSSLEWNAYLADLARFSDQPIGLMVLADCGLPSPTHRASILQLVTDTCVEHPTSVVSTETTVRETVEVFDWLGARVRMFPPPAIMEAMDFVGVPRGRVDAVWLRVRELEQRVEGGRVNAVALADPFVRMTRLAR